ncbi:MAG: hypothetical protein OES46_11360 [Gammaproteobacteria bacterium]|jgi:hypothetical protein|nr:hypothetical protein [Gammaproteobacteria bacterium]
MTRKYQRYSKKLKLVAIRLAQNGDKRITEVATKLGIRVSDLRVEKSVGRQDDAFPGQGKQLGKDAELNGFWPGDAHFCGPRQLAAQVPTRNRRRETAYASAE